MKRPVLETYTVEPGVAKAREPVKITLGIEDLELIFGTDYRYAAGSQKTEAYAGEEGIL